MLPFRGAATVAIPKKEANISGTFASLSGLEFSPLEPRYAQVKAQLMAGHEDALAESWTRLLTTLRDEIPLIAERGSDIIPTIDFKDIDNASPEFCSEHRKRGVAVIRNVIPEQQALDYKRDVKEYISANPQTKAFPPDDPQVYELYWSPSQVRARAHPNLIKTQRFLLQFWHSRDPNALISSSHPTTYADRLRIRQPGDARFSLGPHVDNGSCERWEADGYGRGGVYTPIFSGNWELYDPFESSSRIPAQPSLYDGVGQCSMLRMYQGWLSLSTVNPFEGTLLVNPLLAKSTSYFLLRPFFTPKQSPESLPQDEFLHPKNWTLEPKPSSWLHGATPGCGQELREVLHPHLNLRIPTPESRSGTSMVHIPLVRPGDYVAWHCDQIHAVDSLHAGKADSSVLYIPACPLTVENAAFLKRQRSTFLDGTPGPDYGGGEGERGHLGRLTLEEVRRDASRDGLRAMGLERWDEQEGLTTAEREVLRRANEVLGF
ncbi:DUF1479-domain-containing protein [Piedraia hortae CBS 480.64]|uniref:DUF1479-domain-containing protein n=1 Tax=Piedraia hortae CBS 480.64 TaxID=1314780 RepID=A0A6A7C454_9PEZI|nr:DUF1479-domain-containing protein [Piedraia hortae CBS 480.64]